MYTHKNPEKKVWCSLLWWSLGHFNKSCAVLTESTQCLLLLWLVTFGCWQIFSYRCRRRLAATYGHIHCDSFCSIRRCCLEMLQPCLQRTQRVNGHASSLRGQLTGLHWGPWHGNLLVGIFKTVKVSYIHTCHMKYPYENIYMHVLQKI